jgi:hypothetical protein
MNSIVKNIEEAVEKSVSQYIHTLFKKICDKWEDVDINELIAIWNDDNSFQIATKKSTEKKVKESSKTTEKGNSKEADTEDGCPYVFAKGEKEGSTCGSKPKTGCEYCSRHQKFEGIGQDTKKKLPKAKSQASNSMSEKASSVKKAKSPPKKSIERVIKINKDINKYWNAETQLVFKSKDERVVYATFRDEKLEELNDDDVMLCEQYGFKYEKGPLKEEVEEVEDDKVEESNKKKEDDKVEESNKKKEEIKVEKKVEKKKKEDVKVEKKVKEEIKIEKKKDEIKVEKKSLSHAIDESNLKAKDIENVLNELQLSNDDEDDEFIEEEFEEEEEDY